VEIMSLRKLASNALSLLASDVMNRAATFVLYAMVARFLGEFEFGQMSLALTLFYTFQVFAVSGLKTLVTREVAKNRTETGLFLVSGSIVVLIASVLTIAAQAIVVRWLNYGAGTATIILLLSLALVPFALSAICEGVFQAWEQMHYAAYANLTVNLVKIGLALAVLGQGYGLLGLILVLLAAQSMSAIILWLMMLRHIVRPRLLIDPRFTLRLATQGGTFLGIDAFIAVMSSLNLILLSKLAGETDVGLFSAAMQVLVPVTLVYRSIALSVFPMMCRRFDTSIGSLQRIAEHLISLLVAVALPAALGLYFLSDTALLLLYGDRDFALASPVLQILVWTLLLGSLTTVLGQVLVAGLREKVTLRIVAVDAVVGLVFGIIFISQWGMIGAAFATLLTTAVDFIQHYVLVAWRFASLRLDRLLWKPVIAGGCMAAYLSAAQDHALILVIAIAASIYVAVFMALQIWSDGGPKQFKVRHASLWSK
jgi:O-antigen/teichoic acid export membrane protein